jgi:8-oxo-dGTP pyrophosphatase MutT (NUDIX family)
MDGGRGYDALMHRRPLLNLLEVHVPFDAAERKALEEIREFVMHNPRCFDRTLAAGHVTGSAWLLNSTGERVLLTHHRKLNRWLQLGGHADGNPDILAVALREAREESGIRRIEPVTGGVFDVDVHRIPARGDEPPHRHYDVRFLLRALDESYCVSDESHRLAWLAPHELPGLDTDESVLRMLQKWTAIQATK